MGRFQFKRFYLQSRFFNRRYNRTNKKHWQWATEPNSREKASFLTENLLPLSQSGQLQFIKPHDNYSTSEELPFAICYADGHTEKQMLPVLKYKEKTVVFMGDLLPTVPLSIPKKGCDLKKYIVLTNFLIDV